MRELLALAIFSLCAVLFGCQELPEEVAKEPVLHSDIPATKSSKKPEQKLPKKRPARNSNSINLEEYRLSFGPEEIDWAYEDASGLSYNSARKSLYVVENSDCVIAEIDLRGNVRKIIETLKLDDIEAIAYTPRGVFVAEEDGGISRLVIDGDTAFPDPNVPTSKPDEPKLDNHGLEGLCHDPVRNRFFCVKEKRPAKIYEVNESGVWKTLPIDVSFVKDLSGIHYDPQSGHLLLLSHESKCVVEIQLDGTEVSRLSLQKGHSGLKKDISQAEGITMDEERNIYICSEPDLFFVFSPRKR